MPANRRLLEINRKRREGVDEEYNQNFMGQ